MKNSVGQMNKNITRYNVVIPSIIIALIGLFNIDGYGLYIFGVAFFMADTIICHLAKGYGIIFFIFPWWSGNWTYDA